IRQQGRRSRPCARRARRDRRSEIGGRWADRAALFPREPRDSAPDPAGFLPLRPVRHGAAATRAHRSAQWIDLAAEREKGHVVTFRDRHYWIQRVVYTGIDINRVSRVDMKQNSFSVDFYL